MPRVSDLFATGRAFDARLLFRRASSTAVAASAPLLVVGYAVAVLFDERFGSTFPLLLSMVLLGWGVFSGVLVLQRQALSFLGKPIRGQFIGLVPLVVVLMWAFFFSASDTILLATAALIGFATSLAISSYWLSKGWGSVASMQHSPISLRPLWISMIPAVLAGLNSQWLLVFEQALAASWMSGGVAVYGTAIAVGKLPNMLGDATALANIGYGKLLRSVSAHRVEQTSASGDEARKVFQVILKMQTLLIFPIAGFIALFAHPIVSVLFQRGRFTAENVAQTSSILEIIPLACFGMMLQSLNVQYLLACGRPGLALRYEVIASLLGAALDILFFGWIGLRGLPFAGAISVSVSSMLTFRELSKLMGCIHWSDIVHVWRKPLMGLCLSMIFGWAVGQSMLKGIPAGFEGLPQLAFVGALQAMVFIIFGTSKSDLIEFRKLKHV